MRLALVTLLFLPALAYGQTKPEDEDKVSNDNPARPLQMPPASTEVKEAIDDFERFSRRKAWERALEGDLHHPRESGAFGSSTATMGSSFRSRGSGGCS